MTHQLKAAERTSKTQGDRNMLRSKLRIPAVVYGHGTENKSLELDEREFASLYTDAGTSNLIDLSIQGAKEPMKVLISEVQRNPLTDKVIHVDLHQVRMDEKIRTDVHIEFIGESPAVKEMGGNLIMSKDKLPIECLPKDLPSAFTVDLSTITELDSSIHIKDLKIPEGITVLDDLEDSVVSVLTPRVETEETPTPETAVIGEEEKAAEGEEGEAESTEPAETEDDKGKKEEKK